MPFGNLISNLVDAQAHLAEIEQDVALDMGEDAVEAAWTDLVRTAADSCTPEVARELLRTNGL